jgi:hypothetical protein
VAVSVAVSPSAMLGAALVVIAGVTGGTNVGPV